MAKLYDNILETISNTPVVRINKLAPDDVDLYVKVEAFNPMASVKDRPALGIIEAAEKDGSLKPGQTVIEATSGNTGLARNFIWPNIRIWFQTGRHLGPSAGDVTSN